MEDFLHEETEAFINELNEYLEAVEPVVAKTAVVESDTTIAVHYNANTKHDSAETEAVEVDFEDDGNDDEVITSPALRLPQRALREYSPERRDQPPKPRPACTNFLKRGTCRYGDTCRYAHIQRVNPSISTPSRIKLSNLPLVLLNPADITAVMSKYGHVTGATVYPEKTEASVQFSRGEEALKAFNEFVYDGEERIVIEIESNKAPNFNNSNSYNNNNYNTSFSNKNAFVHTHPTTQDAKLQALLNLQSRQQSLLESNLAVQQSLLTTLQNPVLSEAERIESLATLRGIQEGVMGMQEMLKKTTALVARSIESASNNGLNHSYQKHQMQMSQKQYPPTNSYNVSFTKPYSPATYNSSSTKQYSPTTPSSSRSLDLRPTTLKLSPLPASNLTDIHALQRHFSPYGPLQSLIITEQGQSAVIKYQKHDDAVKALREAGKSFDGQRSIEFSFI